MKTANQLGIVPGQTQYTGLGIKPGTPGYRKIKRKLEPAHSHAVLAMVLAVGKCATDKALATGKYGAPAFGHEDILTGHEVVVRVLDILGDNPSLGHIVQGADYMVVVRQPRVWPSPLFDHKFPPVDLFSDDSMWGEMGLSYFDGGDRPIMVCDARALIAVPAGIKPWHAVLIETGSCPAKARRRAEAIHAANVDGIEYVDVNGYDPMAGQKTAYILGATGACGMIEAAGATLAGYKVIAIGRKVPDHMRAKLITDMGITYVQDDGSDTIVSRTINAHGKARYLFDATAVPSFVDRWSEAVGPTGVAVEFGIPEGCAIASELDQAVLSKWDVNKSPFRRTVNNAGVTGSINASVRHGDWLEAAKLIAKISELFPNVLSSAVRIIEGFNTELMDEYISSDQVVKPVILPNKIQGTTLSGEPILE
jgi:threonine dehydrogenase-like Zn-dependent dehydrogenase